MAPRRRRELITFGNNLRLARRMLKLSQTELGHRLRVANDVISKWESGRHYPEKYTERLCEELGVTMAWLYTPHEDEWARIEAEPPPRRPCFEPLRVA